MEEQLDLGTSSDVVMGDPRVTANDFNMVNETTQDANNLEQSLLYLQQSPYATEIIDAASGTSITFDRADINADQAFMDGSGVGWNPEVALMLSNSNVMSPAVNLASEFAHVVLPGGLDPYATPDIVWDNSAEAVAHQAANVIASELGEPWRSDYGNGEPLRIDDPTLSFKSESGVLSSDTIDTIDTGTSETIFDPAAFIADDGIDFGYDSGIDSSGFDGGYDSYGSDSYGSDSVGFDYGSFSADYGIGDYSFDSFGGVGVDSFGGSGGNFSTDNYFENVASV